MKNYYFDWQRFGVLFFFTFGTGVVGMAVSDEGLGYYIHSIGILDLIVMFTVLYIIFHVSFIKK